MKPKPNFITSLNRDVTIELHAPVALLPGKQPQVVARWEAGWAPGTV
jgi:hypothetical protein